MEYDYLIVGAGLFGCVCAHELNKKGYKCLVVEKRDHIGGNIYTYEKENINIHKYGAHIFHTSNKEIWNYINQFTEFNRFTNSPIANYHGKLYNLPFNMNTFYTLWGVKTPKEAKEYIKKQIDNAKIRKITNLEEQAISLVGTDIYNILIKEYTEKQWGKSAKEIPSFIIKRLPVRFTFDNNYFNDLYQGIPIGGYTKIIEKMLENVEVKLNLDYFSNKEELNEKAQNIIYTGEIDKFFDYKFGALEYRSLRFEDEFLENESNYQGSAVVNYTSHDEKYTRIIEHKHFEFGSQPYTFITKEYSKTWEEGDEPYYPINDEKNNQLFLKYQELAKEHENIHFGGRLAQYKYYDMHQIIDSALEFTNKII